MVVMESPARQSYAVTPDDVTEIGELESRTLYVGVGGTIGGRLVGDTSDRTWSNVPNGYHLPVRFQYIRATGTTASGLIAYV